MNFNEKLIKLRKENGLSQEELGYKLNVTRQTVSKWELGQTTPEMDKLVEMSKIFGVTLDELVRETENNNQYEIEKIEDQPINDKPQNNSTLKVILIIVAVFVIGGMIVAGVLFSNVFNFGKSVVKNGQNQFMDVVESYGEIVKEQQETMKNEYEEQANKMKNEYEEQANKMNNDYEEQVDKMNNDYEENLKKAEEKIEQFWEKSQKEVNQVKKNKN